MSPADRLIWVKTILLRIHVITGWNLPADQLMGILVDQFDKKIIESYPNVNPDEVEYAFRKYTAKEWGKQLNISLIDEVMQLYLESRLHVSRIEEQQKSKLMLPSSTEDTSDEGMDKFWDDTEALVKKGGYMAEFIPPMLYDWMDRNGNILFNKEEKLEYLERAILIRHGMIAHAYEKNPYSLETKNALTEFNRMRETKTYSKDEHERIKELAKKMVVFDMMKAKIAKQ